MAEVFPGKLVRDLIGRQSYKGENGDRSARQLVLDNLNLEVSPELRAEATSDREGDILDSLVAIKQIQDWIAKGLPMPLEPVASFEGWIV